MAATPTTTAKAIKIIAGGDPFGCSLKDTLVSHLRSLLYDVDDLGVAPYYSIAQQVGRRVSSSPTTLIGLLACGTGVGVSIFANKFPSVYAATCLSVDDALNARSINNANILAVSGESTTPETAVHILDTFLSTPFKSPCPASGNKEWNPETSKFLDESLDIMKDIGRAKPRAADANDGKCAICCLVKEGEFVPIEIMPGGEMKIVRDSPTSAIIRFKAGSVEPAHRHTFGHDLMVMKGRKTVWNLSKKERYELGGGDYLYTPAGDVHRVKYYEDTEFFLKWDGPWDIFLDEDLASAKAAIDNESAADK